MILYKIILYIINGWILNKKDMQMHSKAGLIHIKDLKILDKL